MKTDVFLDFQRTANVDQEVLATALSGDWLDQLAKRDLGAGGGLCLATRTPIAFTPTWSSEAVTFTDVNDLVTLAAHVLPVGTPVVFDTIVTTTGVTEGTIYYSTYSDNTTAGIFCLAATLAGARAGTVVVMGGGDGTANLTTLNTLEVQLVLGWDESGTLDPANSEGFQIIGSSGPITVREARVVTFDATGGTAEDQATLAGHGMSTGTPIILVGTDLPEPLDTEVTANAGRVYYVIWLTDNTFQVAYTRNNALAGIPVALTDDGSGVLTVTIADRQLSADGPMIITPINSLPQDIGERYLRVRYLIANGDFLTGKVRSHLVMTEDLTPKNYPSGWEVQ